MLILKTLSLQPMHGFGIARRVEQISRGVFKVNPGSLLTALQRLERAGWLDAEWRRTEHSRRAKFYTLTRAGRKQLELATADWSRRVSASARLHGDRGAHAGARRRRHDSHLQRGEPDPRRTVAVSELRANHDDMGNARRRRPQRGNVRRVPRVRGTRSLVRHDRCAQAVAT